MCCVIYYVYLKCKNYFKECCKKKKEKEEIRAETLYNAQKLNEYVRNKERTYWASYCY